MRKDNERDCVRVCREKQKLEKSLAVVCKYCHELYTESFSSFPVCLVINAFGKSDVCKSDTFSLQS